MIKRKGDTSVAAVPKIVMGIDPGTNFTGYGVVSVAGNEVSYVAMGFIELGKLNDAYAKLRHIFERVSALIDEYHPDEVAFESPFYGDNVQSMLKLGRAQGVAMAAALTKEIPVFEYAPRKIKLSITGKGAASKEQVAAMLKTILKLAELPVNKDSTDGLAVAMCHYYASLSPLSSAGKSSWADFVKKNPKRVV